MLKKLFDFDPAKHSLKTEIAAGITTFLTMAYILAVNPEIFSNLAAQGMDTHAVFTATTLAAIVGTVIMAVYAKKPFGLAPGMGLNAFFVFTIQYGFVCCKGTNISLKATLILRFAYIHAVRSSSYKVDARIGLL